MDLVLFSVCTGKLRNRSTQVYAHRELARGLEYGTDHRVTSKKSVLGRSSPSASSRYDQSSEAKAEIDPEARSGEPEVRATSRSKWQ